MPLRHWRQKHGKEYNVQNKSRGRTGHKTWVEEAVRFVLAWPSQDVAMCAPPATLFTPTASLFQSTCTEGVIEPRKCSSNEVSTENHCAADSCEKLRLVVGGTGTTLRICKATQRSATPYPDLTYHICTPVAPKSVLEKLQLVLGEKHPRQRQGNFELGKRNLKVLDRTPGNERASTVWGCG